MSQLYLSYLFLTLIISLIIIYYVYLQFENFNNELGYKLTSKGYKTAILSMDAINMKIANEGKNFIEDNNIINNKINHEYNYRDMATAEIVLGSEREFWAKNINHEIKNKIDKEVDSEIDTNKYLFTDPDYLYE